MIRQFLCTVVVLSTLSACSSQKFYNKVQAGTIIGNPYVKWEEPNKFELENHLVRPFAFRRHNGELITPRPIKTDGGSVPRALWNRKGFSPWTYAPGYLIHDWLYEANRRRVPGGNSLKKEALYYDKEKSDWILAEVIKTQMESDKKAYKDPSPARLAAIYWAVKRFGDKAWNGKPTPVAESPLTPFFNTAIDNLPLMPTLNTLQNEFMTLPPDAPENLAGSTTPHWLPQTNESE